MGHLHRQALVQRAKLRDALAVAAGVVVDEAKNAVNSLSLATVGEVLASQDVAEATYGANCVPSRRQGPSAPLTGLPRKSASVRARSKTGKRRAKAKRKAVRRR